MTTYYVDAAGSGATAPYDTWAKAAQDIQVIIDLVAAADIVYCQGHQDVDSVPGAAVDFDGTDGTWDDPIKFIGCDVGTTNEPPEVGDYANGNRYVLDANSASQNVATANGMDYVWLVNLQFENSGNGDGLLGVAVSKYWVFSNCRFTNNASDGVGNAYNFQFSIFRECMHDLNSVGLYYPHNECVFYGSRFLNNSTIGLSIGYMKASVGCVFDSNDATGSSLLSGLLLGCTFAEHNGVNDEGALTAGATFLVFIGCRFSGNYYGLNTVAGGEVWLDYCYFDNDDTDITANETVWQIPDKTNTPHVITAGSDTNYGYETGEYNLDPDTASYFNEPIVVPSS